MKFLFYFLVNVFFAEQFQSSSYLELPPKKLVVCNNKITNDIPGGPEAILKAGRIYVEQMINITTHPMEPFDGKFRKEFDRVVGYGLLPYCNSLTVFGNETTNYDGAKRFCFLDGAKPSDICVAYSIGSFNQWDFEEDMHKYTHCKIETFDCSLDATIPKHIRDRTRFHRKCLGNPNHSNSSSKTEYLTLEQMNKLAGYKQGPDYLKVDIEVSNF